MAVSWQVYRDEWITYAQQNGLALDDPENTNGIRVAQWTGINSLTGEQWAEKEPAASEAP